MPGERDRGRVAARVVLGVLLAVSAVFFVLHFFHLSADFPNNSPWMDWAKYTDEGWYGDAAIRHYLTGHWYWSGDFNPAVALPVWPALELIVFKFTGVSPMAARGLTVCVFGLTLMLFYVLLQRAAKRLHPHKTPLAGAICVLLLCLNPFIFAFERMAILEPLLIALTALALLVASWMGPAGAASEGDVVGRSRLRGIGLAVALGVLIPAIVLTKTTGIFLLPAIFYMVWARAGYGVRAYLRLAVPPAALGLAIWLVYFFGFVRPHYLADYQYLFSANAYTGLELQPMATVVLNAISDGGWMGHVLYPTFFIVLGLALFWRPRLFADPLFPALLLWAGGYFAFLVYHNNLQPRYYLVIAIPVTAAVALALDNLREARGGVETAIASAVVGAVVLGDRDSRCDA